MALRRSHHTFSSFFELLINSLVFSRFFLSAAAAAAVSSVHCACAMHVRGYGCKAELKGMRLTYLYETIITQTIYEIHGTMANHKNLGHRNHSLFAEPSISVSIAFVWCPFFFFFFFFSYLRFATTQHYCCCCTSSLYSIFFSVLSLLFWSLFNHRHRSSVYLYFLFNFGIFHFVVVLGQSQSLSRNLCVCVRMKASRLKYNLQWLLAVIILRKVVKRQ